LASAGDYSSQSVQQGIDWLLRHQDPSGDWNEDLMTGTGFPNVFYLKYHLYSHYFPLLALGTWREGVGPS